MVLPLPTAAPGPPPILGTAERRAGVRVLVVSPTPLLAEALSALLRERGLAVLHDLQEAGRLPGGPEVVVAGPGPVGYAVATCHALAGLTPGTRVVALVDRADAVAVAQARTAGIAGLLDARAEARDLHYAIHAVRAGDVVYPAAVPDNREQGDLLRLSDRQREVLDLVAAGRTNREIADELMISVNTVKFHVRSVFQQLGIASRVEATRVWTRTAHPVG